MKKQIWQTIASGVWEGDPFQVATFDTSSWTVPNGSVTQTLNVGVTLATTTPTTIENIKSTRTIPNGIDFTLTVEYDASFIWTDTQTGLQVYTADGNYSDSILTWLYPNGRGPDFLSKGDNNGTTWEDAALSYTDGVKIGQLLLWKEGTLMKSYRRYTVGGAWVQVGSHTFTPTTPLHIGLIVDHRAGTGTSDTIFKNLVILPGI